MAEKTIIRLDAADWSTVLSFLYALRDAFEGPHWHGMSPDAFIDSMIWGGINGIEPPYEVRIAHVARAPGEVRDYIALMTNVIAEARAEKRNNRGVDADVVIAGFDGDAP